MEQSTAKRRLVKSPPELWAQVSSADALSRRLAPFGEIRITRLQPETTVAWEGDRASGTVQLEPSGWGTQVTLSVTTEPQPASAPAPEPVAEERGEDEQHPSSPVPHRAAPKRGFLARVFRRRRPTTDLAPAPPAAPVLGPPAPDPEPPPPEPDPAPTPSRPQLAGAGTVALLGEILDDLGAAHHRPFSRG